MFTRGEDTAFLFMLLAEELQEERSRHVVVVVGPSPSPTTSVREAQGGQDQEMMRGNTLGRHAVRETPHVCEGTMYVLVQTISVPDPSNDITYETHYLHHNRQIYVLRVQG